MRAAGGGDGARGDRRVEGRAADLEAVVTWSPLVPGNGATVDGALGDGAGDAGGEMRSGKVSSRWARLEMRSVRTTLRIVRVPISSRSRG